MHPKINVFEFLPWIDVIKPFYCGNLLPFHGFDTILCYENNTTVVITIDNRLALNYHGKKFYNICRGGKLKCHGNLLPFHGIAIISFYKTILLQ